MLQPNPHEPGKRDKTGSPEKQAPGFAQMAMQKLRFAKYRFDEWIDVQAGNISGAMQYVQQELNPGILNLHRRDHKNIGDMECASLRHVNTSKPIYVIDLKNTAVGLIAEQPDTPVVIGGGGLYYYADTINALTARHKGPVIGWAIGRNNHFGARGCSVAEDRFKLLGVRDWGTGHEWVPCASCMSPLFDRFSIAAPVHDIVVYEHRSRRLHLANHPTLDNCCMNLESVLGFLASGETVVTNSYHGVYWATLLGRKVVMIPFSDRFLHLRYPAQIARRENYLELIAKAQAYPEAIGICRQRNVEFAEKVSEVIGIELNFRTSPISTKTVA